MKGQKKTHQEKMTIVNDFLETGMSYKETAAKHQASYNNIYSWVKKYQQFGPDGLTDSEDGENLTLFKQKRKNHAQKMLLLKHEMSI